MIHPLLLTEVVLPDSHPRVGTPTPVYAFLIDHHEGPVLVDTGVGLGHADIVRLFSPVHHSLDDALATLGTSVDDITLVVNTHLHFDHCGNNHRFTNAFLVAQRRERALVGKGYTVPEWADPPDARWREIDGGATLRDGLEVIPTPGHTPGHQSIVVRTSDRTEVVCGQTLYDPSELEGEQSIEPLSMDEQTQTRDSARLIKSLDPDVVYFSHTAERWTRR